MAGRDEFPSSGFRPPQPTYVLPSQPTYILLPQPMYDPQFQFQGQFQTPSVSLSSYTNRLEPHYTPSQHIQFPSSGSIPSLLPLPGPLPPPFQSPTSEGFVEISKCEEEKKKIEMELRKHIDQCEYEKKKLEMELMDRLRKCEDEKNQLQRKLIQQASQCEIQKKKLLDQIQALELSRKASSAKEALFLISEKNSFSLLEIINRNSKNSFIRGHMATEFFQDILRGLLNLVKSLEESKIFVEGILTLENIRYAPGMYHNPKFHSMGSDTMDNPADPAVYYKQLRHLIREIMAVKETGRLEEFEHFFEILDKVIDAPHNVRLKKILNSHLCLYAVADRMDFMKALHLNREINCTLARNWTQLTGAYDWRQHPTLKRRSMVPIEGRLREIFTHSSRGAFEDRQSLVVGSDNYPFESLWHYVRFVRNSCMHVGEDFAENEVYDGLANVYPRGILYIFKVLDRVNTLCIHVL